MTEWGFYGRKGEIAELKQILRNSHFFARAVIGRRGVGKTELIKKALKVADTGQPSVYMEMTADSHQNLLDLETALKEAGIADLPDNDDWKWWRTADDPARDGWGHYSRTGAFCDVVKDLLAKNVIVALDEFHHASDEEGGLNLESSFKQIIDEFRLVSGTRTKGKLIVAGSHQQRLRHMLRDDRPLFLRMQAFPVDELPEADLMRMAAEHGWLRRPMRFLAMYAVYDGIPDLWETYHRENRGPDARKGLGLDAIDDDDKWRQGFFRAEIERCLKEKKGYGFDDDAHTSLSPDAHLILSYLSRKNKARFASLRNTLRPKDVNREDWKKRFTSAMTDLANHIGVVDFWNTDDNGNVTNESEASITDPNTLFQVRVRQGLDKVRKLKMKGDTNTHRPDGVLEDVNPHMKKLLAGIMKVQEREEGFALERLTAGWFRGLGFAGGTGYRRGDVELDAYGTRMTESKDRTKVHSSMLVASCKRDFRRLSGHGASDLDNMAEIYLDVQKALDEEFNDLIREDPDYDEELDPLVKFSYDMRKIAVAPVIPEGAVLPPMADEMVDIREMARRLDIDPDAGPDPEANRSDSDGPVP